MNKSTIIIAIMAVVAVTTVAFVVMNDDPPCPPDDSVVLTTNVSGTLEEHTYDRGAVIEAPMAPTLDDGYIFGGWTTDLNNIDDLYDFSEPLTSNMVIYAIIITVPPDYDPDNDNHLVQFKYNLNSVPMSYSLVNHMDKASFPQPADVDGYRFDAWYTDLSFTELVNVDLPIVDETTYYGKYVSFAADDVKIYFDCGIGTIDGLKLLTKTVQKGTTYQAVFDSVKPVCENYVLDGWYYDKTYSSRVVPSDAITRDVYVYANWSPTLDVDKFFGIEIDDVLDTYNIDPSSIHVDGNTIYIRLATVTGDVVSSGTPIKGTGGSIEVKTSSSTISVSTISKSICSTYEETIRIPHFPISSVEISVGVPNVIEAGVKFDIDLGDTTVRTLEQYVSEESQSSGSVLSYGVTYNIQSINGMWYRIAHTTSYQIIQCIEVIDTIDPLNPIYTSEYMVLMEPLVIQLQYSDNPSFDKTTEKEYYDLDKETIVDLIGECIIGVSREDMNEVTFHSQLGDNKIHTSYIKDGECIDDLSYNYFSREGYWIAGWSTAIAGSGDFSRESILGTDTPIYDKMDLYAIWLPDRLKTEEFTLICNQKELSDINEKMDGHYVLAGDLRLTSSWTPIGYTSSGSKFFEGTFDGADYTISGLSIVGSYNFEWISTMGDGGDHYAFIGLFSKLGMRSEICNVVFEGATVKPSLSANWMCAGVLAGYVNGSNVHDIVVHDSDLYFNNTNAKAIMGGIVGIVEGNATISDCIVDDDVSVYGKGKRATSGGVAGSLEKGGCTVSYCVNHAKIFADGATRDGYAAAGGIAGGMKFSGTKIVNYCYNDGTVETHSYGKRDSAGIVGRAWDSNPRSSMIENCWILENVYVEGTTIQDDEPVDGGSGSHVKISNNQVFTQSNKYQLTNWFKGSDWTEDSTDLRCDSIGRGFYLSWDI